MFSIVLFECQLAKRVLATAWLQSMKGGFANGAAFERKTVADGPG